MLLTCLVSCTAVFPSTLTPFLNLHCLQPGVIYGYRPGAVHHCVRWESSILSGGGETKAVVFNGTDGRPLCRRRCDLAAHTIIYARLWCLRCDPTLPHFLFSPGLMYNDQQFKNTSCSRWSLHRHPRFLISLLIEKKYCYVSIERWTHSRLMIFSSRTSSYRWGLHWESACCI